MDDLRQRTLSGLGWSGATQVLGQALQFVFSVVLARLLSPREFGLMGMILVFTGFAANLPDLGLGVSIIQKRSVTDRHLDSVFWLNVAAGSLLTILFGLVAPQIALFYGEPALRRLTAVLALQFVLSSLNVVQSALLEKSLDFRTKFRIESVAILVSGGLALFLALKGAGVWSLAGQSLSQTAVRVAMMWWLSGWRPGIAFDLGAVRELLPFGGNLVGFGVVTYVGRNIDRLVVGRLLGSAPLGLYNLADRLMRLPLTHITGITNSVMFPALSARQDSIDAMKGIYLRATRMIALLTLPMMIGLSVVAEPAILVVYGDSWREAIGLVEVMCLAGMAQSVYNTSSWVFLSRGRTDTLFRLGVYATLVRVAGVCIGVRWGVQGVAWAYVLGSYLFICYPTWSAAGRLVSLGFREILRNLAGPFYCASAMGGLVWGLDRWLLGGEASWLRLASGTLFGLSSYGFLIRQFRLQAWTEVQMAILEMGGRRARLIRWLVGVPQG